MARVSAVQVEGVCTWAMFKVSEDGRGRVVAIGAVGHRVGKRVSWQKLACVTQGPLVLDC